MKKEVKPIAPTSEFKPCMTISSKQLKSIKGMKVGRKFSAHMVGKVKGIRQSYNNPKEHEAEVEMHSIEESKKPGKGNGWKQHTEE